MRALVPDKSGHVHNPVDGVPIFYEVFHAGARPTVLLMPPWSICHSRIWKAQVPFLTRLGFQVLTFDNRGNGQSGRPATGYSVQSVVGDALAVLDAQNVQRAHVVGLSAGARYGMKLAADAPGRVDRLVLIAPSLPLIPELPPAGSSERMKRFFELKDAYNGWEKFNAHFMAQDYRGFLEFFFSAAFSEAHSTKQIEDGVGWGMETTSEVLVRTLVEGGYPDVRQDAPRIQCPVLILHGDEDAVVPVQVSHELLRLLPDARLQVLEGAGHLPPAREPVRVNLALGQFLAPTGPAGITERWTRPLHRRVRRVLFVSSPIGLGHARRDLEIVRALREKAPDVEVDWLTQEPVASFVKSQGERVHPLSAKLAAETAHLESEAHDHDLQCFQALRRMDEILVSNFHVFHDAVRDGQYDAWVADEGWDIDYFLHENPELKSSAFVWLTDFVGWLPQVPDEDRLTADYNAEMIEQLARFHRVRDCSLFVGNPEDIVSDTFGPGLPTIRDWTRENFQFCGYVRYPTGSSGAEREELRERFGYRRGERVVIASVGGTAVGRGLLQRAIDAFAIARAGDDSLRMVAVAGPRIDPARLVAPPGVEVVGYVADLPARFAACDLALVQGGLSSTMELVASNTPFLYFPLRHHFEQNRHVPQRLANYGVPEHARVHYHQTSAEALAERLRTAVREPRPQFKPIEEGAAARIAERIAALL